MAIVFTSPKKQQRATFWVFALLFLGILSGLSIVLLLPEIQNQLTIIPAEGVFTMPDIKVNFGVVDSDKVKNLEPFGGIPTQYTYVATDPGGKEISGTISSESKEDTQRMLEQLGLKNIVLKEANIGRTDPFIAY